MSWVTVRLICSLLMFFSSFVILIGVQSDFIEVTVPSTVFLPCSALPYIHPSALIGDSQLLSAAADFPRRELQAADEV